MRMSLIVPGVTVCGSSAVREAVAFTTLGLECAELRACTGGGEHAHRAVRHTAVEFTICVPVKGATCRSGCVLRDPGQFERLAVVEGRVPAAMVYADRVLRTDLIEIAYRE